MTRRIINRSSPGTGTKFGDNDLDYVNKYLTGFTNWISSTEPTLERRHKIWKLFELIKQFIWK